MLRQKPDFEVDVLAALQRIEKAVAVDPDAVRKNERKLCAMLARSHANYWLELYNAASDPVTVAAQAAFTRYSMANEIADDIDQ